MYLARVVSNVSVVSIETISRLKYIGKEKYTVVHSFCEDRIGYIN